MARWGVQGIKMAKEPVHHLATGTALVLGRDSADNDHPKFGIRSKQVSRKQAELVLVQETLKIRSFGLNDT